MDQTWSWTQGGRKAGADIMRCMAWVWLGWVSMVATWGAPGALWGALEAAGGVRVPEGFRVDLFAGEPDVRQPIAMAFDDRGRLWVAECYTYADLKTNFDLTLRDRIVILEDTDQDGRFDRRKVFWDQGQRLTSLAIGFGGVWVLCAPEMLFIPDRDGDDVPDGAPVVLLDGWDAGPVRHNIVNGLKWGPDGWLYGRHGIQATSVVGRPGTPEANRIRLNCSIWRYHPVRHEFEVVCHGGTNSWGHDWDERGELFFINTVIGHLWHGIPGAYYRRMYGDHLRPHLYGLIDQHADHYHWDTGKSWTDSRDAAGKSDALGGGHAHSGLMIYLGDNWPEDWRRGLFTLNFHGRRINHDRLERAGSGWVGRHAPDFAWFRDPWFRGIDLAYGPDGGVFVLDWSDTGECHENDEDGVHRDTGRIFKVTWGDVRRLGALDLGRHSDRELVRLQLHANEWMARVARRVLQERAAAGAELGAVKEELHGLFGSQPDIAIKLRALWALHVLDALEPEWLLARLAHEQESVRAWAVRLLAERASGRDEMARAIGEALVARARVEPSGLVRLYLASALQRLPVTERLALARVLSRRAEDAEDHNLPLMLWYGVEPLVAVDGSAALELVRETRIPLLREYTARRLGHEIERQPGWVNALCEWAAMSGSARHRLEVVRGLAEGLRGWRSAPKPAAWDDLAGRVEGDASDELLDRVRELGQVFGDERSLAEWRRLALDRRVEGARRRSAIRQLSNARASGLFELLRGLLSDPETMGEAARGLARMEGGDVLGLIAPHLAAMAPADQSAVLSELVSRRDHAWGLLEAIGREELSRRLMTAFHVRQIRGHGDAALDRKVAEVWGEVRATEADKREVVARYRALLTPGQLKGADRARGRELFAQLCGVCHQLFGEGSAIGPDLTGSGRGNLDYLLENILDPNAVVPMDYRLTILDLEDGRVLSGVVVGRTERTLTVQTPTELLTLDRADVEAMQESELSLMPEGLIEPLEDEQVRDLIGFLMFDAPGED
jgi:putative membrane-bound dehydrogenase-like protein